MSEIDGRARVVIENVKPEIDCGRFPIKRVPGEEVQVEADLFCDGHDVLSCVLLHRKADGGPTWIETPMQHLINDRWRASFRIEEMGNYVYTVQGWVDRFKTWKHDLKKKFDAGQDISIDLLAGIELLQQTADRAPVQAVQRLQEFLKFIRSPEAISRRVEVVLSAELAELMFRHAERASVSVYPKELRVLVDPPKARFSAWYELFPRSWGAGKSHGTLRDCAENLSYVAEMGFDVLYLPPIHPIGTTKRKGRNNTPVATPEDTGSPWAIGAPEGGHKSIHPQLGRLEDFRHLVSHARELGIDVALDIAFQCSPDHPYLKEHPEWFRKRPDGTMQYAENPPKKYEDIYPFDFETEQWRELWQELKSIVEFWVKQGVHIFRVDNPHTKSFSFWQWAIAEIRNTHPDVIFLSEAFTRPKVMYRLAKLGFTQSYTYFAWRNAKWELTQYFQELTKTEVREYFRPNAWPNTPDILTEYLQIGGRPAFMIRFVLAATLCANYGIYGPAFELIENRAPEPHSEEYLDSEKYEIRKWDIQRKDSLKDFIARVNRIRRENPALQSDWSLRFHDVDNEQLICFSKRAEQASNSILAVVNLDPFHTHSGWIHLPLDELDLPGDQSYQVHDLLSGARYVWQGDRNYVELNPHAVPAHIFRIRRRVRTERDFEYFM